MFYIPVRIGLYSRHKKKEGRPLYKPLLSLLFDEYIFNEDGLIKKFFLFVRSKYLCYALITLIWSGIRAYEEWEVYTMVSWLCLV